MFDEKTERHKLAELDLTDDVIQIIIDKKRASYELKNASLAVESITKELDDIPDYEEAVIEEPTYYPTSSLGYRTQSTSGDVVNESELIPVIPEPPMNRDIEPPTPSKRRLPWQKK